MSQEDFVKILNAKNRVNNIEQLHSQFLEHLCENSEVRDLESTLSVETGRIATSAWGYEVSATPRLVRDGDRQFAYEYVFQYQAEDESTPIWQCYLTADGRLALGLDEGGENVCDFNNNGVAKYLLIQINLAVLNSELLAPAT